jgi:uncharacterized membrane protein YeaQ/YmgE (transglycosylase-associated protein family)
MLVLADIKSYNFIPDSGFLDQLFHQTWLAISIFGNPANGYKLTLIGLLITLVIALTANFVTEKLTSKKVGSLFVATVVTILGSWLFQTYVLLPFDFALEGVRIIAALLGAIVVAVFYVLIRGTVQKGK